MCAQLLNKHVSAQPGVATVAIGKGVDGDQPVMETDGDLIHRLHPIGDVGQQNRHLHADLPPVGADALVAAAVLTGPTPALAEHLAMQTPQPALFQRPGPLLAEQPEQSSLDVLLFPFVELASVDQMGAPQTLQLLAIQWRSPLLVGSRSIPQRAPGPQGVLQVAVEGLGHPPQGTELDAIGRLGLLQAAVNDLRPPDAPHPSEQAAALSPRGRRGTPPAARSLRTCSALASTRTQPPVMKSSLPVSKACSRRCWLLLRS
jgi:hypothetical protein